jgi:hypothetical protein
VVAGGIQAGPRRWPWELDKLGVIVEDRLPDPAMAGYGQLTYELFFMLAFAAEAPGPGSMSRALGLLWDFLAAMDRRDRFMAARDRSFATCDVFPAPAMPVCAWHVEDGEPGGGSLVCPPGQRGGPWYASQQGVPTPDRALHDLADLRDAHLGRVIGRAKPDASSGSIHDVRPARGQRERVRPARDQLRLPLPCAQ